MLRGWFNFTALQASGVNAGIQGGFFFFCFIFKFLVLTQIHSCPVFPSTLPGQCGSESIHSIHPLKRMDVKIPQTLLKPCPQAELQMRDVQMMHSPEKA